MYFAFLRPCSLPQAKLLAIEVGEMLTLSRVAVPQSGVYGLGLYLSCKLVSESMSLFSQALVYK